MRIDIFIRLKVCKENLLFSLQSFLAVLARPIASKILRYKQLEFSLIALPVSPNFYSPDSKQQETLGALAFLGSKSNNVRKQ